ncbi:hypothetical protein HYQ46_000591 [Verticillium longisporum]|nr:hypothetical protein HYQ46_000591 [Verticillium longisporum]
MQVPDSPVPGLLILVPDLRDSVLVKDAPAAASSSSTGVYLGVELLQDRAAIDAPQLEHVVHSVDNLMQDVDDLPVDWMQLPKAALESWLRQAERQKRLCSR